MRLSGVAGLALALIAPGAAMAGDALEGHKIYWRYCSSCHGEEADGMGPMRPVLVVAPKDLTVLARDNGGIFPLERVISRIDGRDALVSHGSEMPVYGDFFNEGGRVTIQGDGGETVETSGAVADLLAYLMSRQGD